MTGQCVVLAIVFSIMHALLRAKIKDAYLYMRNPRPGAGSDHLLGANDANEAETVNRRLTRHGWPICQSNLLG